MMFTRDMKNRMLLSFRRVLTLGAVFLALGSVEHGSAKESTGGQVLKSDNFADGDFAQNPTWIEKKPGSFLVVPADGESAVQLGKAITDTLHLVLDKPQDSIVVKVRYRYPQWGQDFSQVWIGIQAANPEENYSVHISDVGGAYGSEGNDNNIAIMKSDGKSTLAMGNTGVPYDNDWHVIKLVWDGPGGRLEVFYDDNPTPVLACDDRSTFDIAGVYIGGTSNSSKDIQFADISIERLP